MKKTTTRRPRQTRQPRRPKGSSSRPWVVLLCLIALCIGAYWLAGDKDTGRETSSDRQMEQIETVRDDGKDAVYTDTSQELSAKSGAKTGRRRAARFTGRRAAPP